MTDEERFEAWLAKVCERSMPRSPIGLIDIFAKELSDGASEYFWEPTFGLLSDGSITNPSKHFPVYKRSRWSERKIPTPSLLESKGYLQRITKAEFRLSPSAFQLVGDIEPPTIFISYRRIESSAFALLVLARLKQHSFEAFLDMTLEPGEVWHAGLKERIQQYDYFVVLLSKDTLESQFVRKEILWAQEANLTILPIWHNGFEQNREEALRRIKLDESGVREVVNSLHPIRVTDESALGYNNAIIQLLNRFDVTPE